MEQNPEKSTAFIGWLQSAGPDEWHQVAQSWNWDYGTKHLRWIAEQAECDLGTALLIFWRSAPTYNLNMLNPYRPKRERDRISIDLETIELQILILRRWVNCDFERAEIAFTGGAVPEFEQEHCAPIVPFDVILDMTAPRPGRTIARGDFIEGVPPHIQQEWAEASRNKPV